MLQKKSRYTPAHQYPSIYMLKLSACVLVTDVPPVTDDLQTSTGIIDTLQVDKALDNPLYSSTEVPEEASFTLNSFSESYDSSIIPAPAEFSHLN